MLKFGLILVFFGRIKIGLVFGFCGCHFIGIGLVLVCHFPENDISNFRASANLLTRGIRSTLGIRSSERENLQQSTVKEHARDRYFSLKKNILGEVKNVRTK